MKNLPTPVIVDYGMGNLWSVHSSLRFLGYYPIISGDLNTVLNADILVLPGVGSFKKAINQLNTSGLSDALKEAVIFRKRKILGICLGMQLFSEFGFEDGLSPGLGFIPGFVNRFDSNDLHGEKLPHMGFNEVIADPKSRLFEGLTVADFYFAHSYRLLPEGVPGIHSKCTHGKKFLASVEFENIFATQFHPEKSQTNGLKLLRNFLKI